MFGPPFVDGKDCSCVKLSAFCPSQNQSALPFCWCHRCYFCSGFLFSWKICRVGNSQQNREIGCRSAAWILSTFFVGGTGTKSKSLARIASWWFGLIRKVAILARDFDHRVSIEFCQRFCLYRWQRTLLELAIKLDDQWLVKAPVFCQRFLSFFSKVGSVYKIEKFFKVFRGEPPPPPKKTKSLTKFRRPPYPQSLAPVSSCPFQKKDTINSKKNP